MKTFKYITEIATNTSNMTNKEVISFHYFNPNGLWNKFEIAYGEIFYAVNSGLLKSGWLLAYDGNFYFNLLNELHKRQRVSTSNLHAFEKCFKEHIDKIYKRLSEI